MEVFCQPFTQLNTETAVALGFFDGVHTGHQAVISQTVRYAKEKGLNAVVWTFDNSPKSVFSGQDIPVITTAAEKQKLFEEMGVDILISFPFDEKVQKLECADFAEEILYKCLRAKKVFCGFNYSFGAGGKGTPEMLNKLCASKGIDTEILAPVEKAWGTVSSSRIREMIEKGDVSKAAELLGRPYSVYGTVTHGKKLGRTIGFPTVNQVIESKKVIPKDGVYLTRVLLNGDAYYGITDIGVKPTVGTHTRGAETYIFGFKGDLYGKNIKTEFLEYLRKEKKFESVDELKKQISCDEQKAKEILRQYEN